MSMKANIDDGTGNSEKDWEIFDVLCQNMDKVRRIWIRSLYHHINLTFSSIRIFVKFALNLKNTCSEISKSQL